MAGGGFATDRYTFAAQAGAAGGTMGGMTEMDSESAHILVVDDHREIRDALAKYLGRHGYRVSLADSAAAARRLLETAAVDLAVVDIMMPGEDGLSLTRDLRARTELPVVLLTAVAEETDRIVGLELGADDYVTKPFNPRELLARIKAVLRRAHSLPPQRALGAGPSVAGPGAAGPSPGASAGAPAGTTAVGRAPRLRFADWVLDLDRRELLAADGTAVPLSTGEFLLLGAFLRHPRRVLSRDQLLDLTRGRAAQPFDRAIDNQVSRLRRKIEADPKRPRLIVTHWGGGYAFAADVRPADLNSARRNPAGGPAETDEA